MRHRCSVEIRKRHLTGRVPQMLGRTTGASPVYYAVMATLTYQKAYLCSWHTSKDSTVAAQPVAVKEKLTPVVQSALSLEDCCVPCLHRPMAWGWPSSRRKCAWGRADAGVANRGEDKGGAQAPDKDAAE